MAACAVSCSSFGRRGFSHFTHTTLHDLRPYAFCFIRQLLSFYWAHVLPYKKEYKMEFTLNHIGRVATSSGATSSESSDGTQTRSQN